MTNAIENAVFQRQRRR